MLDEKIINKVYCEVGKADIKRIDDVTHCYRVKDKKILMTGYLYRGLTKNEDLRFNITPLIVISEENIKLMYEKNNLFNNIRTTIHTFGFDEIETISSKLNDMIKNYDFEKDYKIYKWNTDI